MNQQPSAKCITGSGNQTPLDRYFANPSDDTELRKVANIPDDAYYTVSVWPVAGRVTIDHRRSRSVPKAKISKSNQT